MAALISRFPLPCDFITVSRSGEITDVIQVCSDLGDPSTLSREVKGIISSCKRTGASQGTIITYDQQDKIERDSVIIDLVPLPVFLCN